MTILHIFMSIFRYIVVGQKHIVSLPYTLSPTPWDILPISLEKNLIQNGLCIGFLIICLYSMATNAPSSMIALAILVIMLQDFW